MNDPTPPPAPTQSAWRKFRAAPLWAQILAWSAAAFTALVILGVAIGDDTSSDEPKAAARAATTEAVTTPAPVATSPLAEDVSVPAPVPAPPEAPPAPEADADTGRMSDGEFELSTAALDEANEEILAYGEALGGECAALFGAFEAAAAIKCVKDGYDGVEGDLAGVVAQMDDVRDDVAKQCRAAVNRVYRVANVPLFRALRSSRDAFVSIDAAEARRWAARLRGEIARWNRVSLELRVACDPAGS